MNLLAKEQMKAKEPGLTLDEATQRTKQFLTLYYRLRKRRKPIGPTVCHCASGRNSTAGFCLYTK